MQFHIDGTVPKNGEIFVFGSNRKGIHGAGAALEAKKNFGAIQGQALGFAGQSYAIPTKDGNLKSLTLEEVSFYVNVFKQYASIYKDKRFFITRIGCGLAGFSDKQISEFFKDITENCSLPEDWRKYL